MKEDPYMQIDMDRALVLVEQARRKELRDTGEILELRAELLADYAFRVELSERLRVFPDVLIRFLRHTRNDILNRPYKCD